VGVARRLEDARLHAMAIVYGALATVSSFVSDGAPAFLFDEDVDHLAGVLPSAASAAALAGAALLAPATYRARTEAGLLAFLADLRRALDRYRVGLREALVIAGAALATIASAFLLLWLSFEWGHIASSALAAAIGAALLGVAGARRSDRVVVAAFVWLAIVGVEALAYDGPTFDDVDDGSTGGWSILAASAALTAGSYALRVLQPDRRLLDLVCGVAVALSFVNAFGIGIPWLEFDRTSIGIGWLVLAAMHAVLAAGVFRRQTLRDFTTVLWVLGAVALVASEIALIEDGVARTIVVALTAVPLGILSVALRETRLWLGGASLILGTTALSLVFQLQPWVDEESVEGRFFFAAAVLALCSFVLAALRWGASGGRDETTAVCVNGIVAVLAAERLALGDWPSTLFAAALTAAAIAVLARPLDEHRLWIAGVTLASVTTAATVAALTSPEHFFTASASPGQSLWVLLGCVAALAVAAVTAPATYERSVLPLAAATGIVALYAVSLGILELAQAVSSASVETDFERGHTAVSGLWALIGLALLLVGLLRGSALVRYGGLALFGLSLAKIFLYDLAELSSVARAFSFIFVGALLLVGGFFLQRLSDRLAPSSEPPEPGISSS
jgi:Predicted membrane protein (DUF2339)